MNSLCLFKHYACGLFYTFHSVVECILLAVLEVDVVLLFANHNVFSSVLIWLWPLQGLVCDLGKTVSISVWKLAKYSELGYRINPGFSFQRRVCDFVPEVANIYMYILFSEASFLQELCGFILCSFCFSIALAVIQTVRSVQKIPLSREIFNFTDENWGLLSNIMASEIPCRTKWFQRNWITAEEFVESNQSISKKILK